VLNRDNVRLATLPTNKYLENTECFNYRIRKKSKFTCNPPKTEERPTAELIIESDPVATHII
jgi:hypothetical protein